MKKLNQFNYYSLFWSNYKEKMLFEEGVSK